MSQLILYYTIERQQKITSKAPKISNTKNSCYKIAATDHSILPVARDEATRKSDIDIMIDFLKEGFCLHGHQMLLGRTSNWTVQFVTKNVLHPAFKKNILKEARICSSRDWAFRIKDILRSIDKIESFTKKMSHRSIQKKSIG